MSEIQTTGEIIAAHPLQVAQADQIQAAEPRKEPSTVVLREWLPDDRVYVLDVERICALSDKNPFFLGGGG